MANSKEIRGQIASIKSTQKITKATEMIAASKIRQAQHRMQKSAPYAERIHEVISHLAKSCPEYRHPFMLVREVKRAGFIVISTDKGLCGGLNANLFRLLLKTMRPMLAEGQSLDLSLIGRKANGFFSRFGANIVASTEMLGDKPRIADLIGSTKMMLDAYAAGDLDALFLVSNRFVNTMTQRPEIRPLLPIQPSRDDALAHHWDYLYEPDPVVLLDVLLRRHIEAQVYQAVIENLACEQAAKMVAMKNATENAGQLIDELQISYNKARQAAITTELTEIVAGADAV